MTGSLWHHPPVEPPTSAEWERMAASDVPFERAVAELWRGLSIVSSVVGARLPREQADALLVRMAEYEAILREARAGYDEFYESGNIARLLNAESRIRNLYPPLGVGSDGV